MPAHRRVGVAVAILTLAWLLTACGGSPSGTPSGPVTVDIVEKDGAITPRNGETIDVGLGEPITLHITTDADDDIHVHSIPEHEYEITPGTKNYTFSISTPGRYIIESEGLGLTLVILQVS